LEGGLRDSTLGTIAAAPPEGGEDGKDERVEALWSTTPLNAKDKDGETGLMKAAAHGHVAVVKRFLGGSNVEIWEVDKKGRTALMHAAENGQDAVVRQIVTFYGGALYPQTDPFNIADARGRTALMLAADKGHANVVRTLLDTHPDFGPGPRRALKLGGAGDPLLDVGRKDDDGKTALDLAEAGKHAGAVELLKKDGK
jgi:ankyrin repeat protein